MSQASIALLCGSSPQQKQALLALVEGTGRLIEQDQDAQGSEGAARLRAELHVLQMRHALTLPAHSPLRRVALWHRRLSHEALMAHVQENGHSPVIDDALQAGCLVLQLPWSGAPGPAH